MTHGYESIGTGMTESSEYLLFPTTGIYLVNFQGTSHGQGGSTSAITARISTQKVVVRLPRPSKFKRVHILQMLMEVCLVK